MLSPESQSTSPKVVTTTPLSFSHPKTRHRTTDTKRLTSIPTPKQFQETPFSHSTGELRLAYKWIRIIFRLWKTHTLYDENVYIKQLKKRNSPVVKFLKTT